MDGSTAAAPGDQARAVLDLADRLFTAVETGDLDAVRAVYAPDVEVWLNVTGIAQDADENLAVLELFVTRVRDRRYEVEARDVFAGGLVQRHVLHGILPDGTLLRAPACMVIHVRAGQIHRIYEYLDFQAIRPLFG